MSGVAEHESPRKVLQFWFGDLDEKGDCEAAVKKQWFQKDPEFDARIRENFGGLYASLVAASPTKRPEWADEPEGLLAAIIVLDQFSRNMFRDSAGMFAADDIARMMAYELIALGQDKRLPMAYRIFAYMPLMHSERLVDQERCVQLFRRFAEELEGDQRRAIENNVHYAVRHRDIVKRFGRFPHRNEILERPSTPEESEFLKEPNSGF